MGARGVENAMLVVELAEARSTPRWRRAVGGVLKPGMGSNKPSIGSMQRPVQVSVITRR
jgi:hypothetical protein